MSKGLLAILSPLFAVIGCSGMNVNLKKFEEKDAIEVAVPGNPKMFASTEMNLVPYCRGKELLRVQFLNEEATKVWCARD